MSGFRLDRWDERGLAFERRANTSEMQSFLGGVEPDEALTARHERILKGTRDGTIGMFLILVEEEAEPVGSIGFWEKEWRGGPVFELGWKVLPGFQGRGLAGGALREALSRATATGRHRWGHAYPRVDNAASNALCRKVGFELLGETDFEFPKGNPIRCNDWRFDLLGQDAAHEAGSSSSASLGAG
jgi:RimJ/RimL family protein N-acetyltransferase